MSGVNEDASRSKLSGRYKRGESVSIAAPYAQARVSNTFWIRDIRYHDRRHEYMLRDQWDGKVNEDWVPERRLRRYRPSAGENVSYQVPKRARSQAYQTDDSRVDSCQTLEAHPGIEEDLAGTWSSGSEEEPGEHISRKPPTRAQGFSDNSAIQAFPEIVIESIRDHEDSNSSAATSALTPELKSDENIPTPPRRKIEDFSNKIVIGSDVVVKGIPEKLFKSNQEHEDSSLIGVLTDDQAVLQNMFTDEITRSLFQSSKQRAIVKLSATTGTHLEELFDELIGQYAKDAYKLVPSRATFKQTRNTAKIIYHCSGAIAAQIIQALSSARHENDGENLDISARSHENKTGHPRKDLSERVQNVSDPVFTGDEDDNSEPFDESGDGPTGPSQITEYLTQHPHFTALKLRLRGVMQAYGSEVMTAIHDAILDRSYTFSIACNLPEFVRSRYGKIAPRLAHMLSLTGSCHDAQLTTVGEYFAQTWPNYRDVLLAELQSAVEEAMPNSSKLGRKNDDLPRSSSEHCTVTLTEMITIEATGSHDFVRSIGQQIAWFGAVCTTSPESIAYCHTHFHSDKSSEEEINRPRIEFTYESAALDGMERKLCWHELLGNIPIVTGFPIPNRPKSMTGLQVPLEIMAQLGRVLLAEVFDAGIVLKGDAGAFDFYPVSRAENHVQWHQIPSAKSMLPYDDDGRVPRLNLQSFSMEDLGQTIICLGWTPHVMNYTATKSIVLSEIQPSESQQVPTRSIVFSGFGLSISKIVGTNIAFAIAETQFAPKVQQLLTYEANLRDLAERVVILYDTGTHRGWLLDAERAVYQILLHRSQKGHFGETALEALSPDDDIRSIMTSNRMIKLGKVLDLDTMEDKYVYFATEVRKIREKLHELALAGQVEYMRMRKDPRYQRSVIGFEYENIVHAPEKATPLWEDLRSSCGEWPQVAHHQLCATILFAKNFQEVLSPARTKAICQLYRTVPSYHSLLAVEAKQAQDLLATKSFGIRGVDSLYPECTHPHDASVQCTCQRVLSLRKGTTTSWEIRRQLGNPRGAVIFGNWKPKLRSQSTIPARKEHRVSELVRSANGIAQDWVSSSPGKGDPNDCIEHEATGQVDALSGSVVY